MGNECAMIKSRRNPGGTGGNCRPKLFLSQLFFKAKASVLEDALKSVWLKCLRVAVRPHTMNPRGLDGGVASLSCSHNSPVNCDYHPNITATKFSLPLLAWSSKNRVSGPFEDIILFKLSGGREKGTRTIFAFLASKIKRSDPAKRHPTIGDLVFIAQLPEGHSNVRRSIIYFFQKRRCAIETGWGEGQSFKNRTLPLM